MSTKSRKIFLICRNQNNFTLIEILVVIAMIAITIRSSINVKNWTSAGSDFPDFISFLPV